MAEMPLADLIMACEKCWGDAYLRWMALPNKSQAEHYRDLLEERKDAPCTPAEQKGEDIGNHNIQMR